MGLDESLCSECRFQLWSWSSIFQLGIEQVEVSVFSLPSMHEDGEALV